MTARSSPSTSIFSRPTGKGQLSRERAQRGTRDPDPLADPDTLSVLKRTEGAVRSHEELDLADRVPGGGAQRADAFLEAVGGHVGLKLRIRAGRRLQGHHWG